jgi:hypothetical protein
VCLWFERQRRFECYTRRNGDHNHLLRKELAYLLKVENHLQLLGRTPFSLTKA